MVNWITNVGGNMRPSQSSRHLDSHAEIGHPPFRVLLVDDQPFFLGLAEDMLAPAGFEVLTAPNGTVGLEVALAERPDAILLDVEMPEMDGLETCRRLKANPATAAIPVVILTSALDARLKARAAEVGAAASFLKVIAPDRFREILAVALETARAHGHKVAARGTT